MGDITTIYLFIEVLAIKNSLKYKFSLLSKEKAQLSEQETEIRLNA